MTAFPVRWFAILLHLTFVGLRTTGERTSMMGRCCGCWSPSATYSSRLIVTSPTSSGSITGRSRPSCCGRVVTAWLTSCRWCRVYCSLCPRWHPDRFRAWLANEAPQATTSRHGSAPGQILCIGPSRLIGGAAAGFRQATSWVGGAAALNRALRATCGRALFLSQRSPGRTRLSSGVRLRQFCA